MTHRLLLGASGLGFDLSLALRLGTGENLDGRSRSLALLNGLSIGEGF